MGDWKRWLRANSDRAGAWLCVVLGLIVLFVGWRGVSNTAYPAEQLPYIVSGGIGGALVVALGATLLISADLRDEWRKLDRIERRLSELQAGDADRSGGEGAAADGAAPGTGSGGAADEEPSMVRDTPISGVAPEPAWGGAVAQTTEVDVDEATAAPDSTSSTTARPSATRKRAARRTDGTADKVAKATAQSRPTPASKRPRPAKGDAS